MSIKTKTLIGLIVLCIVDMVIPIPVLGIVLLYVLLNKPAWFQDMMRRIYRE